MCDDIVAATPSNCGKTSAVDDMYVAASSDIATTCEEKASRGRSMSSISMISEIFPLTALSEVQDSSIADPAFATHFSTGTLTEHEEDVSYTPIVAPLHPSLAALSLNCVEESSEAAVDIQLPAVTTLAIHRLRSVSDLLSSAKEFSVLSTPAFSRLACKERVPGWQDVDLQDIVVDQILSGLSNQLFKVSIREDYPERSRFAHGEVLFRIYGKDVNSLYDSSTEVCVFKMLGARGIAPHLIAEVDGGRIEEWIEGAALLCQDMCKSSVLISLAGILAGLHQVDLSKHIDTQPCIDKFLTRWRAGAMAIYASVTEDHPSYLAIQRLNLPKLAEESYRLNDYLFPRGCTEHELTRLTFCHNDLQENNVMVTHNYMRLIDFEYSGYNYPAFDLASFFWEMTCNYCVPSTFMCLLRYEERRRLMRISRVASLCLAYPFFLIDPTRYPSIDKRRLFCAMYLSKLTQSHVKTSNIERIDPLLDSVERFQLASHMLWAFWSVIRAPQAITATQFDMLYYAQKRYGQG